MPAEAGDGANTIQAMVLIVVQAMVLIVVRAMVRIVVQAMFFSL